VESLKMMEECLFDEVPFFHAGRADVSFQQLARRF